MTTLITTDLDERTALSDRVVALLRTAVPGLWAALVTTLLRVLSPHLPGEVGLALADLLRSELAVTFVVVLVLALWYWLWRRVEPLVPDWLVRLVLGSARTPVYGLQAAVVEIPDGIVTTQTVRIAVTPAEAALVADYRALEARPNPADVPDPDDDVDEVAEDEAEPVLVRAVCSCGTEATVSPGLLHVCARCGIPLELG